MMASVIAARSESAPRARGAISSMYDDGGG
jgi:hypothetical protein